MTQRRCQSCREFYDKKLGDCPTCGTPPYAHNSWLVVAKMNNALYAQAEHAARTA